MHTVGYNAVTDNTGLSSFYLAVVASEFCEIPRKFELTAVQGHRSWFHSKARMQFLLFINSNFGHYLLPFSK